MKTTFLLILLCFFSIYQTLQAQQLLFEQSRLHYPVAGLPWAIETGDFNNDNKIDFITASRLERSVTLRLGNGDGTFNDSTNFSVGISPRSLITGDFNGDENLDVAVANLLSNDVTILFGDGTGQFPTTNTYTVGDKPRSIIADYFNSDTYIDLAVANRDDNSISILTGNGDGTFSDPIIISTSGQINPRQVRSEDLDNNQILDLVVIHDEQQGASAGQKYGILLGNGDGTFKPIDVQLILAGNGFSEAVSLTLGHFDDDQSIDMVVSLSNSAEDEIVSFSGNGDGTFNLIDVTTVGTAPFFISNFDFSNDGYPDILVSNTGSNKVTLHTNRGDGTFRNEIPGSDLWGIQDGAFRVGDAPRWHAIADVNGDGLIDLLSSNEEGNDVSISIAETDTTFIKASQFTVGSPPQAFPSGSATHDFNNDQLLDLVVTNWGSSNQASTVSVLLGNGDGTFTDKTNYTVGSNPDKVIAKDFNKDNEIDLAVLNTRDSIFSLLTGKGDGTFNDALAFSLQNNPDILRSMRDMVSADFNSDGREDIVIVNYNEDYLAIFFGNEETIFDPAEKIYLTDAWPERLAAADFNGDEYMDILLQKDAQFIGQNPLFEVFLGDGTGAFSEPVVTEWPGENTIEIMLTDFDNNSIPDMMVLESKFEINQDNLIIFRGNNDGSFSQAKSFELVDPSGLYTADLIGDGHVDLLVGSFTNADIKVFEGDGNGNFAEQWPSYGLSTGIRYFVSGDYNDDGTMDFATTGGILGESYVSVVTNTGFTTSVEETESMNDISDNEMIFIYPNPFSNQTLINYSLSETSFVSIEIYDLHGKKVEELVSTTKSAGEYRVSWKPGNLPGGTYFCTIRTANNFQVSKVIYHGQ